VALSACLSAATAAAQTPASQKASAEVLFDEGVRLLRAGSYQEACAKLETSEQVEPAVGTLLYLGECFERVGRTASAWASFREASALAQSTNQPDRKKIADERAARLEAELAWLKFEVAPETRDLPGLEIRRATEVVPVGLSGNETPIDPGEIVVQASAPGHVTFSTKVRVAPKGRAVVTIPWLRDLPAPAQPPPPPAPTSDRADLKSQGPGPANPPPRTTHSKLPWILDGIGVVGLGVGAVFGVRAIDKAEDARVGCPNSGAVKGLCMTQSARDAKDSAVSAALISNVAFVAGGAALLTGVILHFVLPPQVEEPAVGLTPIFDRSSAGLAVTGRLGS
jgi:serine/threonine-protein kinase